MGRLSTGYRFRMSQSLILVDGLFLLDGERRREGKKKGEREEITTGEEGFPGAGPTLLTVPQVMAVRCNYRLN
jgi:hypothetical protein